MSYDPNKPADHSPISSAELRAQLAELKALIDQRPTMDQVLEATAGPCKDYPVLTTFASNPPTQLELQTTINYINDVLDFMKR